MLHKSSSRGFSGIEAIVAIIVIVIIGLAGWWIWKHNHAPKRTASANNSTMKPPEKQLSEKAVTDQSDNGKYLLIKEWGIKVALPQAFQGKVTYIIDNDEVDPDTNLPLQAARIYVADSALSANDCGIVNTILGAGIDLGAQYIRSNNKAFDAARYKGSFRENILTINNYSFHINYLTPDCLSNADTDKISTLQDMLLHPVKAD